MRFDARETLEITIAPDGAVHVHVSGIGGPRCLDYVEVFQNLLGPVQEQQLTPEYYEQNFETASTSANIGQGQQVYSRLPPDMG